MGIGNIFHSFQPKDKIFFVLFEKVTANLVAMANDFNLGMKDFDPNDDSLLKKMSDYEHKNDDLTHEILIELSKNFITPFDREDIHTLATGLDDIADYIYASAKYIYIYKAPHQKAYIDFALLIHKACLEVQNAMRNLDGFKNMPQVKEACIKVNSIENIADDLLSNSMVELFEAGDAINVIKVSSVLNNLEIVTDKAEDVANTIETIMIKYA
ncbi:DUF47 domain-containing protein [Elizabethkingia sp. JS20170427COW]|uniref:DUF47 domain-containing protein n=1 Tax=Elizabethkingia sp. JS20170427COW TaxID=2583851 RepID=UPI00111037AB|nr:DUF47 family protein [Elizabethkingia sp. JS20170427COW]QCX53887.1 DUF47 domain-containing protein [Elizabethkingia sp. JS20170427COW]